jgi:translation initiation factor eIF-2B subunit delta
MSHYFVGVLFANLHCRSSVVERVLLDAWSAMREKDPEASFSVVVVDSRPLNEGESSHF